jgi:PTH1 family peptidyl-tRNA hydrolase
VEYIAAQENIKFSTKKSQKAALSSVSWNGEPVSLAYPLTYMNLSGEALALLVKYWKVEAARDLLVVVDDVALPFGKFRLRMEGSAGGHNGLASIEEQLGSRQYSRLRIGIGASESSSSSGILRSAEPLRDYVLSSFNASEEKKMKTLLECGWAACRAWVLESPTKAMSQVNASVS